MIDIEGRGSVPVGTIYGIGRNYADHARELGNQLPDEEPVVFLKAISSLRGLTNGHTAYETCEIHYEAELVIRIGRTIPLASVAPGWDDVDAVGLGLDLTNRKKQQELKSKGLPWTLAKSFLGSTVLTPMIPKILLRDRNDFQFNFFLEGKQKQAGDTNCMLFSIPKILHFLSSMNVLQEGDLIFTGTPAGVGPISKGQRFTLQLTAPERIWHGQF